MRTKSAVGRIRGSGSQWWYMAKLKGSSK